MGAGTENGSSGKSESSSVKNPADQSWTAYVIINYRWILVCFFLLPISFIYDFYYYARSWIIFKLNSAPEKHQERVQYIQKQVEVELLCNLIGHYYFFFHLFHKNSGERVAETGLSNPNVHSSTRMANYVFP